MVGYRPEILPYPVIYRHGSDLTTERDRILVQWPFLAPEEHLERVQFVAKRRGERDDDRRRSVLVADVVLDDQTGSGSPLF
jgi:hypothetical protein